MLSLDDCRWKELGHRNGANHAPYVSDELKILLAEPRDFDRFKSLWPYLSSEGTTWEAAYAATPYIVEIAKKLHPKERFEYLCAIGTFVINSCPDSGDGFEIKPFLAEAYEKALSDTLPLLIETLLEEHGKAETRYLLAATAALKGHVQLGEIIEYLDYYDSCPDCSAEIFKLNE